MRNELHRFLACGTLGVCLAIQAAEAPSSLPSFKELEARGAIIGTIRVDPENIFDLSDPRENFWLFRLADFLHIRTRDSVIRGGILFKSGERVSARLIEETERLFRMNRYLYDVDIRPASYHDGVVDIDVITRDTWTLDLTGRASRTGGANSFAFGIKDTNLLGTAATLGISRISDPDRHGSEFEVAYPRLFDGWTKIDYLQGHYSDGRKRIATLERPFYALETRWAAGATGTDDDRIDPIYNAGDVVSKFRHHLKSAETYAGWSRGLIDGWTQRYSIGATGEDDTYGLAAGETAPAPFPVDHKMRGPFARWEVVEDRFLRTRNRDQIARTEFVSLGFNLNLQVIRSLEGWGSTQSAWLYNGTLSDGYTFPWGHDVLGTLVAERRLDSTGRPLSHEGVQARYFAPHSVYTAFYGLASFDRLGSAAAPDQLQIGGDTGLRGYPLRYQEGERRALLSLEERAYTDWYPFRLLRVGGAVFYDVGRAWGGVNQNVLNPGWLSDVGVGLRFSIDRAAFANVLHVDLAFPLHRTTDIKSVQFVVKSYLTF
ncbi:MAG: hypothetical protein ACM3X5_07480 [Bacillota bacterium]